MRRSARGVALVAAFGMVLAIVVTASAAAAVKASQPTTALSVVRNPGWTSESPSTNLPLHGNCGGVAYDSARGRVVVAGNFAGVARPAQPTWEYDGASWSNRTPALTPMIMDCPELTFDGGVKRTILLTEPQTQASVGDSETWSWDGTTWRLLTTAHEPIARTEGVMGYDPIHHQTILYGGRDDWGFSIGDMWAFDGTDWRELSPPTSPGLITSASMTFDAALGGLVLAGGLDTENRALDRLWFWDGGTWHDRGAMPSQVSQVSYDARAQRLVGIGNVDGTTGVWSYDGRVWTRTSVHQTPPAMNAPSFIYDAAVRKSLLLGVPSSPAVAATVSQTWSLRTTAASAVVGFVRVRAAMMLGGELTSTATLSSRDSRPFAVQIRRHGTSRWVTQSRGRTTSTGVMVARFHPPGTGLWDFRVNADPELLWAGTASGVRTVAVAGRARTTSVRGLSTRNLSLILTQQASQSAVVSGGKRVVDLEVRAPGRATFAVTREWATSSRGKFTVRFTPTATGTWYYRVHVRATPTFRDWRAGVRKVSVRPIPVRVTTANPSLLLQVNVPAPQWLRATGGSGPYSWTVVGGHLPPGMSLSTVGLLGGGATAVGSFVATAQVRDKSGWTARTVVRVVVTTGTPLPFGVIANRVSGPAGFSAHLTNISCPTPSANTAMYLWIGGPGAVTPSFPAGILGGFSTPFSADVPTVGADPGDYQTGVWCVEGDPGSLTFFGVVRSIPFVLHVTAGQPVPTTTASSIHGGEQVVVGDGAGCGAYPYPDHATVTLAGDAPSPSAVTVTKDVPLGTDGHFADVALTAPSPAADNPVTKWTIQYSCSDTDGSSVESASVSVPAA